MVTCEGISKRVATLATFWLLPPKVQIDVERLGRLSLLVGILLAGLLHFMIAAQVVDSVVGLSARDTEHWLFSNGFWLQYFLWRFR